MARYTKALCRLCRREGMKLFLKGQRCLTEKCACSTSRRPYIPGMHHNSPRRKLSEYGKQLREKQKAKRIYGIFERQFRRYFSIANRLPGETGENLLRLLATRLDNVVYEGGFALSRRQARLFVTHGKVLVNGKRINIPSYQVKPGQRISLSESISNNENVLKAISEAQKKKTTPSWFEVNYDKKEILIKNQPTRTDISVPIQEQLIVELYSK
ncbi:MAG: 30S ribosomal protein S4 [Candidatus Goldbacteria bacterium]|nr:30S ribosomal protein S4 [Candidatus Goldiibacteriota bacterium]